MANVRAVHNMSQNEPVIRVDPASINTSFVCMPVAVEHKISNALMQRMLQEAQPKLWLQVIASKPTLHTYKMIVSSSPSPHDALAALEKVIDLNTESVVLNTVNASFDGGKTQTLLFSGFSYTDNNPRTILPRTNGILPWRPWWAFWK